jgi:hypothetical protein
MKKTKGEMKNNGNFKRNRIRHDWLLVIHEHSRHDQTIRPFGVFFCYKKRGENKGGIENESSEDHRAEISIQKTGKKNMSVNA